MRGNFADNVLRTPQIEHMGQFLEKVVPAV